EYSNSTYSNLSATPVPTDHFHPRFTRRSRTPVQDIHPASYSSRHYSTEFTQPHRDTHHQSGYSYAPAVQSYGYATGQEYYDQSPASSQVQQMYQMPNSNRERSGSVNAVGTTYSHQPTETSRSDHSAGLGTPVRKKLHGRKPHYIPATPQPYQHPPVSLGFDNPPRFPSSQNLCPGSLPSNYLYSAGSSWQPAPEPSQWSDLEVPQPSRRTFLPSPPSTPPMSRGRPSKPEPDIFDPRALYGFDENDVAYKA
ncbi:hypothetical protein FRC11_008710, partial [Ceratobasidium sp. 423]